MSISSTRKTTNTIMLSLAGAATVIGLLFLAWILVTLLIFLAVQAVVQNRRVEGESMLPSLQNEEYLLIDKFSGRVLQKHLSR